MLDKVAIQYLSRVCNEVLCEVYCVRIISDDSIGQESKQSTDHILAIKVQDLALAIIISHLRPLYIHIMEELYFLFQSLNDSFDSLGIVNSLDLDNLLQ